MESECYREEDIKCKVEMVSVTNVFVHLVSHLRLLRHDPVVVDDVVVGVDAGVGGEHSGRLLEVEPTGREEAHG